MWQSGAMPELPEVAALSTFLDTRLRGAVLEKLQILSVAVLKTADPPYTALAGRSITGVERFGKFVRAHCTSACTRAVWSVVVMSVHVGPAF